MILLILIFALLFVIEFCYFKLAGYYNIIDKPNLRSSHTAITLRGGGIIFYIGALLFFCFFGFKYPWFILGLTLISAVSFIDDIRSLPSRIRLSVHFIAMFLMFYQWGLLAYPWWYTLIALIVCTGIINAYNFMDGINGITGGYSLVVLTALAFANDKLTIVEPDFIYVVMMSVIVFNFFNFRKKARCFAGDVGSVSIAFIILFILGAVIIKTADFSYIILLAVYGVDSVLTIIHRLMLRENIFKPHRKHLYQLLANELKISHIQVSGIYMAMQAIILLFYFYFFEYRDLVFAITIVLLCAIYLFLKKKYFYLHTIQECKN